MKLPELLRNRLFTLTCNRMFNRDPDLTIIPDKEPYLRRWNIIRSRVLSIYIHQIVNSDEFFHDHPYLFNISILLSRGYVELLMRDEHLYMQPRVERSIIFRWGKSPHKLSLRPGEACRTIFIAGPRVRDWGFYFKPGEWISHKEFTVLKDKIVRHRGNEEII